LAEHFTTRIKFLDWLKFGGRAYHVTTGHTRPKTLYDDVNTGYLHAPWYCYEEMDFHTKLWPWYFSPVGRPTTTTRKHGRVFVRFSWRSAKSLPAAEKWLNFQATVFGTIKNSCHVIRKTQKSHTL